MLGKIIVTGPECSGKTTLARALADQLGGKLVPEVSRPLLSLTGNLYEPTDLAQMALYQQALEYAAAGLDRRVVICDTSALVYQIWLSFRFDRTDRDIDLYFSNTQALFLLCQPLRHWEPDGLRVNPQERQILFDLYRNELEKHQFNFMVIPDLPLEDRLAIIFSGISKL